MKSKIDKTSAELCISNTTFGFSNLSFNSSFLLSFFSGSIKSCLFLSFLLNLCLGLFNDSLLLHNTCLDLILFRLNSSSFFVLLELEVGSYQFLADIWDVVEELKLLFLCLKLLLLDGELLGQCFLLFSISCLLSQSSIKSINLSLLLGNLLISFFECSSKSLLYDPFNFWILSSWFSCFSICFFFLEASELFSELGIYVILVTLAGKLLECHCISVCVRMIVQILLKTMM